MKSEILLVCAALLLGGCATYRGGEGQGAARTEQDVYSGEGASTRPDIGTDFGRGEAFRINPTEPVPPPMRGPELPE